MRCVRNRCSSSVCANLSNGLDVGSIIGVIKILFKFAIIFYLNWLIVCEQLLFLRTFEYLHLLHFIYCGNWKWRTPCCLKNTSLRTREIKTGKNRSKQIKKSAKKKSVEKPPSSPIIKAPSRTVLVEADVHVAHVEPEGSRKQTTSNLTLADVMSFLKDMKKDQNGK